MMRITVVNEVEPKGITFGELKPGTVFTFNSSWYEEEGPLVLKLCDEHYVLLSYTDGADWLVIGNGVCPEHEVPKVYGHLVGVEVEKRN